MKQIITDGNGAASMAAYYLSETAAIYPITPSSTMSENIDEWMIANEKNLFNETVKLTQLQSEAGAAGTLHGLLSAGSLATTFTSSQGLLLMIPNMYKIAGELLPSVIHVAARTIASHALSIFGDHSDVMAVRQTGWAILNSVNPQEAHDTAIISHLATLETSVPFLHFFDGFRTSHELRKISVLEKKDYDKLINFDAIKKFKNSALNSSKPVCQGTSQNSDIFFQNREANNLTYADVPRTVQQVMDSFFALTGRNYHLFDYEGAKNPKAVVVVMGSAGETCETIAKKLGLGVIKVRLLRPFDSKAFVNAIPKSVKKICVLDRTKEDGSINEPLCSDVINALAEEGKFVTVIGGRYGLGGKEFSPADAEAVFKNLISSSPKNHFSVGITDDVSFKSLFVKEHKADNTSYSCKFYGLGNDGTVSANKNSLKIIGENCNKHVQGFFEYDSKKSGNITTSHLRISDNPIKMPYLITKANFVACHHPSFISRFEILNDVTEGGTFLLNTPLQGKDLENFLPYKFKNEIARKKIKLYTIDAFKISNKVGLGNKINLVMQTAFFNLIKIIEFEELKIHLKEFAFKTYGRKGEAIVKANYDAIDLAISELKSVEVPKEWLNTKKGYVPLLNETTPYFKQFVEPILKLKGNSLPVSAFSKNGRVPTGTSTLEKRGIATEMPNFISENCIGCNMCAYVCPHSCIRPVLSKKGTKLPEGYITKPAFGIDGYEYKMQISPMDCTGCEMCANVCPAIKKALVMENSEKIIKRELNHYKFSLTQKTPDKVKNLPLNVKNSQFLKPYFEFSGACAGCGETPYIKILTQLYGDHMIIANATGCSSIYGGNSPTCPYTKDEAGRGPAWANSLFEDNAEFGYGLYLAYKIRREKIKNAIQNLINQSKLQQDKKIFKQYLENFNDYTQTKNLAPSIIKICQNKTDEFSKQIMLEKDALIKQTFWIIGGDGWAYDIGFGGLDHVLAQNEDIKVLVLDTNVYSNTGGQSSKATPLGAVAKFSSNGKDQPRKNLAEMFMTYKNIYIAQIAIGANMAQTLNAFVEAENYNGPAIIIAYATCINQGVDLSHGMQHMREANECGFWNLFRYNPALEKPFILDSGKITKSLKEFASKETRFTSLMKTNPDRAAAFLQEAQRLAKQKREELEKF